MGHENGDRNAAPASAPVILGGGNLIARHLLRRLLEAGRGALLVARRPLEAPPPAEVLRLDLLDAGAWSAPPGRPVVSVLPLAVLVRVLDRLEAAGALVAIGSTSLFSKAGSPDPRDRAVASSLAAAEAALVSWCGRRAVPYTILRPTLVYDGLEDRNVARMARFIGRYGFLPIAPPARGLRQPIHADDVAKAVLGALDNPSARNRAFAIAGGEVLSYRAMAERVFAAEGRRPLFLPLPTAMLEAGFTLATACRLLSSDGVGASVFRRMNEDLVFDAAPGLDVLAYAPRPFRP